MATHHEESWEWSQQILGAAQAGHSLAEGFRAAAEETRAPRVAAAMRQLADQLEQGVPLDRALTESSVALPTHVQALVRSAARTGQFSTAFGDLVEHERAVRDLKASILDGLAYSLVVTAISAVLILVILFVSGSAFGKLFEDFQISLPLTTRLFFWYRDVGVWLLAGLVILAVIGSWVFRRTQGEVAWADLVATIPVIGHLSLSFGLAEAASLLAVLTRQNIPVPEALELCASGVRHASVRAMTQRWAVATAGGQSLAQAMANEWRVPSSVIPLMSWGERAGVLPEAFEIVRTWYLQQIYARVSMLRMLLPPALFLAIGCFVMLVTGALFMPLAALLQGLT